MSRTLHIAGGGLAGALLALLLRQRGWEVDVFEKRPDPRVKGYEGGRSINLALAERGLHVLRCAGLGEEVLRQAIVMRGRMVHPLEGHVFLQPYGQRPDEVIRSVHRGRLNILLLTAAEAAGARLHFGQRLDGVDFERRRARFVSDHDRTAREIDFNSLIGSDGIGSGLRSAMGRVLPLGDRVEALGHGYRELEIPPGADGGFQIEPEALHIWPRGRYMCIALPNTERTFTVTLFLPHKGSPSFAELDSADAAESFFARQFPDAVPLLPGLRRDWIEHPVSPLGTLRLEKWHLDGRAVLLGDAAHAMVPFHGQGMNCAFEDCLSLVRHLDARPDRAEAFEAFVGERQPNAQAIQDMAIENYLEMRDQVDDPSWRLQRQLELALADRHPGRFVPRYSMVSFLRTPYAVAQARGVIQRRLLVEATADRDSLEGLDWINLGHDDP